MLRSGIVVLAGSNDWTHARAAADAYTRTLASYPKWFRSAGQGALNEESTMASWWSHRCRF